MKTTHDIQAKALSVQWTTPADEKARTVAKVKQTIQDMKRDLSILETQLRQLER